MTDIEKTIRSLIQEDSEKIGELMEIAGLDISEDLAGLPLQGLDLSGQDLSGADLSYSDLSGANLIGANLSRSNLTNANLAEADLNSANLSGALLNGADFRAANITNVDFRGVDLDSVDLRNARASTAATSLPGDTVELENQQNTVPQSALGAGQAALEVIDYLDQAVFLIASGGRIVWRNTRGDQLLRQRDGLLISDGILRCSSQDVDAELRRLIVSAARGSGVPRRRSEGVMVVARASVRKAYQLRVIPLHRSQSLDVQSSESDARPVAAIFAVDPEQPAIPKLSVLARLYNLTPAEAKLATALSSGKSVKQHAEDTKLSINYTRWLLKQVEAKTDTRRIADLIRLLSNQSTFFRAASSDE